METFLCDECLRRLPLYMERDGVCAHCAGDDVPLVVPQPTIDLERVKADEKRAVEEVEAEFNVQAEAKREHAERELARRKLLPFIKRMNPNYSAGWVHADICERLERFVKAIEDGKSPRLMITMPPRHGKSEIGSKTLPAWFLGRNPDKEVIISSYSGELSCDFSRKVRSVVESPKYKTTFQTRLDPKSKAVERWNTTKGGGMVAVGVQGPITGRGMSLGIIDDPVKDREEAESDNVRQKIKDWYSSTFFTRQAPAAGILIIQTRWHEDDLAGWLLSVMEEAEKEFKETGTWPEDADRWDLVEYPAIAIEDEKYRKKGEALHEERYPLKNLLRLKRNMISRDWEALYQQRPVSQDGDYFRPGMFRYYSPNELPPLSEMRIYAAGDLAISQKQSADWTVFVVVGIDRQQNIWLLDHHRGHYGALGIIDKMFEIQLTWNPELFGIETGQIELTLEPFIQKAEEERGVTLTYEKLRTRGQDKSLRARPIQGRMEQGKVYWPKGAVWTQTMVNEMLKFPLGKNDDQVDAIAWIGQMITLFGIVNQKKVVKKSFMDKIRKHVVGDRRRISSMSA